MLFLQKPIFLSSEDSDEPTTHMESLSEFRRIRQEQDEAYAVSLEIDQAKVL